MKASAYAMTFRQTNAIWMVFICGISALSIIKDECRRLKRDRLELKVRDCTICIDLLT